MLRLLRALVGVVVTLAAAAVLLLLAWPQAVGADRWTGVAQLVAFRTVLAGGAIVVAVLAVAVGFVIRPLRRLTGTLGVLLVVFALFQAWVVWDRGLGEPAIPARGQNSLTVLSWNTHGTVAPATIAQQAAAFHADVIALPETGKAQADAVARDLAARGVHMVPHTGDRGTVYEENSTSLLIAASLGPYRIEVVGTGDVPTIVAVPSGGQRAPVLAAVHTVSPQPGQTSGWRTDLAALDARCRTGNAVIAGDFNATLDHLWGLGSGGGTVGACRDAALATGNAGLGSWPTGVPAILGAPIDHVMATPNWRIAGFRLLTDLDGAGSDHRPVLARLEPAA